MIKRLIAFAVVIAVLVAAIFYSQLRPRPDKVSGFLEADEIRVGSRVGGRVATVRVQEGQEVKKGDVLLELEPFDLYERRSEAEAALAARQADLDQMQHGFRSEEIAQAKARYDQLVAEYNKLKEGPRAQEIEVARAQLSVAKAQLTLAQRSHDRVKNLREKGAATADDMDRAGERLDAATATVMLREQELDLLLVGTRQEDLDAASAMVAEAMAAWELKKAGYRSEEIAVATASRDAAQHALSAIQRQIDELIITSPLEGAVEALDLQPGDLVAPSAPVLSLLDTQHLWVRAYVPQNRVGLRIGQQLKVSVDCYPENDFVGSVTFIARQAEFTPSNVQTPEERSKLVFRVKVSVANPQGKLRPGMSADVWLPGSEPGHD